LEFKDIASLDFGFEHWWGSSELVRNRETTLHAISPRSVYPDDDKANDNAYESAPPVQVIVIREASGPQGIRITAEDSRLWRSLKEHIGKDPLWRYIANWRNALLEEFRGRAALNRTILEKVQDVFALKVSRRPEPQTSWLAPSIVWWIRTRVSNLALGNYVPSVEEAIRETPRDGWESRTGQTLAEHLEDRNKGREQLQNAIEAMAGSAEVEVATQNYRDLENKTMRVNDALEELLLIHYIPGRCSLCKKLGAQ
jgi:hypothetical protein